MSAKQDLLVTIDKKLILRLQEKTGELLAAGMILDPNALIELYLTYGLWNHDKVINLFLRRQTSDEILPVDPPCD